MSSLVQTSDVQPDEPRLQLGAMRKLHRKRTEAGLGAKGAVATAQDMVAEIGIMEETIIDLQEENRYLKERILRESRGSLAKFFAADSRLLLQEAIRACCCASCVWSNQIKVQLLQTVAS